MKKNSNLHAAKNAKNDEFYTRIEDIEKEIKHYKDQFKGKSVYLNCDAGWSKFFVFFKAKFAEYGLTKVVATHYTEDGTSVKRVITKGTGHNGNVMMEDIEEYPLTGKGDFRSEECIQLLKECDIVVTNPPFSLFREFVDTLMTHEKKFIILGNNNAVTYKEVFQHIKNEMLWLGVHANVTMEFQLAPHYLKWNRVDDKGNKFGSVPAISWFTNMQHKKRNEELFLVERYNPEKFPKYDNYDAINVDKVVMIPEDYFGAIGVPITFLTKYNPDQFEILNANDYIISEKVNPKPHGLIKDKDGTIGGGKPKYARIVIKRKQGDIK